MRPVAVLAGVAGLILLRTFLQPPPPQVIRRDAVQPAADTAVERGKVLYGQYGCPMCHGADGAGGVENPNSETGGKIPGIVKVAQGYTERELLTLLRRGTSRIGREDAAGPIPPYRMPGWGDRLSDDELHDLVQFLISLAPKDTGWR